MWYGIETNHHLSWNVVIFATGIPSWGTYDVDDATFMSSR